MMLLKLGNIFIKLTLDFHRQTDRQTNIFITSEKIRYQGEENDRKVFELSSPTKYKSNCT